MIIYSNKEGIILLLLWLKTVRQGTVMTTGMMEILKSRDLLLRKMCCNVDIECLPIITVYLICLKIVSIYLFLLIVGRDCSLGIASRYGLEVLGSNPGGGEIFNTHPDRPWGPASLLYSGYRVFPGINWPVSGVVHPPHLAPRLKKE
jgi:hypothetical protein